MFRNDIDIRYCTDKDFQISRKRIPDKKLYFRKYQNRAFSRFNSCKSSGGSVINYFRKMFFVILKKICLCIILKAAERTNHAETPGVLPQDIRYGSLTDE